MTEPREPPLTTKAVFTREVVDTYQVAATEMFSVNPASHLLHVILNESRTARCGFGPVVAVEQLDYPGEARTQWCDGCLAATPEEALAVWATLVVEESS